MEEHYSRIRFLFAYNSKTMRAYKFLDENFGMKSLREKRLKISLLDDLNDPFELLPYEMADRNKRAALNAQRKHMAINHGILCFSATWKDPVLWAHYANKHKGLCLAFQVPDAVCRAVTSEAAAETPCQADASRCRGTDIHQV